MTIETNFISPTSINPPNTILKSTTFEIIPVFHHLPPKWVVLLCALNLAVSNITNWPNIEVSPLITLIIFRTKFMARSMILQYKDKPVTSGEIYIAWF
nr:hypothetical protein [Pseudomonas sp. Irchel s3f7]